MQATNTRRSARRRVACLPRRSSGSSSGCRSLSTTSGKEVVYQIASALVTPRLVPLGLYRRAKALIRDAGIVDVTVLIGWFTMVSATLSAFDVPANAVGLDQ